MNRLSRTPRCKLGDHLACIRWVGKTPQLSQTVAKYHIMPITYRILDLRRSLHMENGDLQTHLKKYYGVDVPVASDGRIEFPWTARNSNDILKQLVERFSSLPAGASGKRDKRSFDVCICVRVYGTLYTCFHCHC